MKKLVRVTPRLPTVPEAAIYDPPDAPAVLPPPPPDIGQAGDYEAVERMVPWPRTETSVYTTRKRWRACDIYVGFIEPPGAAIPIPTFILNVFVHAIVQGKRSLVASGRFVIDALSLDNALMPGQGGRDLAWLVAARGGGERYEVTAYCSLITAPNPRLQIQLSILATDEAVDPPPRLGEISLRSGFAAQSLSTANALQFAYAANTPPSPRRLELVRVAGINTAAAARYLQFYESGPAGGVPLAPTTANMAGRSPMFEWAMGAAIGGGVVDSDIRFRSAGEAPMLLCVSSTPGTYTGPPADGIATLTVR